MYHFPLNSHKVKESQGPRYMKLKYGTYKSYPGVWGPMSLSSRDRERET